MDLIFVVDESGSVEEVNFNKSLAFLAGFVDLLDIGTHGNVSDH